MAKILHYQSIPIFLSAAYILFMDSVTLAQVAPGDEDLSCVNSELQSPNMRPLMDSFNYISLLGDDVWQQVGLDSNNSMGPDTTTSWEQNFFTDRFCQRSVQVCGFRAGAQNNWLITQFINRTLVDGTQLSQVTVQIDFEIGECPEPICQRSFKVYKYERSTANSAEARNTNNYQLLPGGQIQSESSILRNQTISVNFTTNHNGFYLGIVDTGSCITIHRILVFYHVCPEEISELSIRPETVAPVDGTVVQVVTQCVENTKPASLPTMSICTRGGVWQSESENRCVCIPGRLPSTDGQLCIENCSIGNYYSSNSDSCRPCPTNSSNAVGPGVTVCPCLQGHYRAEGEEDGKCTKPPSAPRNLQFENVTDKAVTITWDPPQFDGGRDDLVYQVTYSASSSGSGRLSDRSGSITVSMSTTSVELPTPLTGTEYRVSVGARNGITDQLSTDELASSTAVLGSNTSLYPTTLTEQPSDMLSSSYETTTFDNKDVNQTDNISLIIILLPSILTPIVIIMIIVILIAILICCAHMHSKRKAVTVEAIPYYASVPVRPPRLPPPRGFSVQHMEVNEAYQARNLVDSIVHASGFSHRNGSIHPVTTDSHVTLSNSDLVSFRNTENTMIDNDHIMGNHDVLEKAEEPSLVVMKANVSYKQV